MKIAFFDIESWEKEYLKEALKGHTLEFFAGHITESIAKKIKDYEAISVFVYSKVTKEIISLIPKLKIVTTR